MTAPAMDADAGTDLSIIIVNWNTLQLTRDCLVTVMQGLEGMSSEVIVVDNASDDGSAEMIAREFPQVELIRNDENRGFAAANNQAMAQARGDFVLLLNSDTLVHGTVLPDSVDWLRRHPDVGAMSCRVLNEDGTGQRVCSMFPSLLNLSLDVFGLSRLRRPRFFGRYQLRHWQRDDEREVETVSGCFFLVRRTVIEQVGRFDEAFYFFGEEVDWSCRIRAAGWKLFLSPVGAITHLEGGSQKRLSHRRNVLLAGALVRLHLKHRGRASAIAAYLLMLLFNASRAVSWSLASLVSRSPRIREKGRYFRAVLASSRDIWPETAR
ncbi:glycosyltransferase family 2 protein [Limimaricola litoreus]|uniref:Glycosyltransferase family 2 protein n=1 Tax=Limimaricola litoreus TaxID=2955316 RepID=A0A9X2FP01_9RHOB|nr:glycosyltransferase family 2 protein [Limimaricola litoreus]MCP1168392.1 glycosyltransferase family 2 protein [Limimaricola litoreus]